MIAILVLFAVLFLIGLHLITKGRSRWLRRALRVIGILWSPMIPPSAPPRERPRPRQKVGSGHR